MPLWATLTLMAAVLQAIRTACQKTLAERSGPAAATLARSLFALPLCWFYLAVVHQLTPPAVPLALSPEFWAYSLCAATAQVLATVLMVRLFTQRNFAIGIVYAQTEALLVAALGVLLFNESLSNSGWLAVLLGTAALALLTPSSSSVAGWRALFSPVTALGLCCGLSFALTSLAIRQAGIGLGDQLILNAALTLATVITIQSLLLGSYMALRQPDALKGLLTEWRLASWVGLTSVLGSIGWFTAMMLENPALVKTLGQVEFLVVMILSMRVFKEQLTRRELAGIILLLASIICVLQ